MAEPLVRVDLFCEDGAHEDCGRALIGRCARDSGVSVATTARSTRAGLPRVKGELRLFQRTISRGGGRLPDLLVVLADANDVFDAMDFYRAGRQAPELQTFTDELRGALRLLG